jgi:hypothetical protein
MDNFITGALGRSITVAAAPSSKAKNSGTFKDLMAGYTDTLKASPAPTATAEPVILVGEISAGTPTVSELLIQHKELGSSTWNIINSEQNRDKNYTEIQPGTRIYFDREKGTLSWSSTVPSSPSPESNQTANSADAGVRSQTALDSRQAYHPENTHAHRATLGKADSTITGPGGNTSSLEQKLFPDAKQSIKIGTIDSSNPTVSHLLKNHPQLNEHTWNLLASSLNKGKPFDRIARGTEIFINAETMEITWHGADALKTVPHRANVTPPPVSPASASLPEPSGRLPADLSEAVQKYMGTSYDEINCYELLVKGLHQMDIPYSGKNGLFSKLTRMAVDKGMAPNAYLNGEGIIKAAGSLVLSKNYSGITDWKNDAAALIRELEPLLDNGQILSFSTEKRGHTGIVSQKDKQWTFINSGRLDNSVNRNSLPHGVGEETLSKEINNWFKTAHARREMLSVTLGRLSQGTIRTALNLSDSVSKQI